MEAFVKVADGKATKIIIPSELQNIVNLATAFTAAGDNKLEINQDSITKELQG